MMLTADTALSRDAVMRWAEDLYSKSVDRKDAAGFARAFAPDGWVQFGNWPRTTGREAITAAIAQFFDGFQSLSHRSVGQWLDGRTLVLEAEVTYLRHDGRTVTVPACTIFRLAGAPGNDGTPQAKECRIYVDLGPLYAG
ncbi:MAG TPA: nuclear transport factor 2 family protein [Gemmatimonadaceae bacterium]|jgi:hypothetical protein